MPKANLSPSDILYICVPTNQNTINIFPIEQMKIGLSGKLFIHFISTTGAVNKNWNTKLRSVLSKFPIQETEVKENMTFLELEQAILLDLQSKYTFEDESKIVINYGGGLKILTPVLFNLHLSELLQNCKFIMTYFEKQEHFLVWDNIVKGKIHSDPQKKISIGISSSELLRMYGDFEIHSYHVIDRVGYHKTSSDLIDIISNLPNLYIFPDFRDFLFEVPYNNNDNEENENSENRLDGSFDSIESFFNSIGKEKIKKNIEIKFNNQNTEYEIYNHFIIKKLVDNPKLQWTQISSKLATLFLDPTSYNIKEPESYFLNNKTKSFFDSNSYLTFPPSAKDNGDGSFTITKEKDFIKNMFSGFIDKIPLRSHQKTTKSINSHSIYFELFCLNVITEWATNYPDIIHEVTYDFQTYYPNSINKFEYQADIMVYTSEGTIIFFECKTHSFSSKDFLSAYLHSSEKGGVFNDYVIVLPPLPTPASSSYNQVHKVFSDYDNLLGKSRNVSCCQINATNDLADLIFPSLDSILKKIIDREGKT